MKDYEIKPNIFNKPVEVIVDASRVAGRHVRHVLLLRRDTGSDLAYSKRN